MTLALVLQRTKKSQSKSPCDLSTRRERDDEAGIMHYRARSYDPRIARFPQVDPLLELRIHSHYIYCDNSPTSKIDPTGNQGIDRARILNEHGRIDGRTDLQWHQLWVDNSFNAYPQRSRAEITDHSVSITGSKLSIEEIWRRLRKFQDLSPEDVSASGEAASIGSILRFSLPGVKSVGQHTFPVRVTHINETSHRFQVRTMANHPLQGVRAWQVRQHDTKPGVIVVQTIAIEHPAGWLDELAMRFGGKSSQMSTWKHQLERLLESSGGSRVVGDTYDNIEGVSVPPPATAAYWKLFDLP